MKQDLDNALRRALRPVDPGEDFTNKVLALVAADAKREPRAANNKRLMVRVAVAASFALVAGFMSWSEWREHQGRQARAQLMEALKVTSEKLDIAYQAVNNSKPEA